MATSSGPSDRNIQSFPQRVFTEEQVGRMRRALDAFRPGDSYQAGRWMVSPLNRDASIVRPEFRPRVKVRDITLRTIEQMGIIKDPAVRRRLIVALAEAGVDEIMVSAFRRGHREEELRADAEAAAKANPECLLFLGSANTEEDIRYAHRVGYGAVQVWMGPYLGEAMPAIAGAVYRRAWQGKPWDDLRFPTSPEGQIERVLRLAETAAKHGIKLSCSILILSYATLDYVEKFCKRAAEAGAYDVMLGDHSSALGPEAWTAMCRAIRQAAPDCNISVHPHDMFGLATACALAGLKGGANTAEVAINGMTEGPEQADLAHTVASLKILYGANCKVDLSQLTGLSRLAEEITGETCESNRGITGSSAFVLNSPGDEYIQELKVDALFHRAIEPAVVGNAAEIMVSIGTGPFTVWDKLESLGFGNLAKHQVAAVYDALQAELRRVGRTLRDEETRRIAEQTLAAFAGKGGAVSQS